MKRVPRKYFSTKEDFNLFIETEKEWMFSRIVESIEEAFEKGRDHAQILVASIDEDSTSITLNSGQEEWLESLSLAIKWFSDEEAYEKCAKIRDLMSDIKSYATR